MLEKPTLSDDKIQTYLNRFWGIRSQHLEFLPIGNDSSAWIYRVKTDIKHYFLKIRKGIPHPALVQVPHYLQSKGIRNVVAPIPTQGGDLYTPVDDYALIVYDWIHGSSAWELTLSDEQWHTWGAIMRQIHDTAIGDTLSAIAPRETFICKWNKMFNQVNEVVRTQAFDGAIQRQTADYWLDQQDTIDKCYLRVQEIGRQLQQQSHQVVLCHADIHKANIMIDEQEHIHIVDWDEVIIAPKERDLMFFVEDGHQSHKIEAFLQGYGETNVSQLAITYYRYEWVVQEFGDYGERIFFNDSLSQPEKQFALDEFQQLFSVGDVVEAAVASDKKLKR